MAIAPDSKVRKSCFQDLSVKEPQYPDGRREWHTLTNCGDFEVQLVDTGEDFSINESDAPLPGI